MGAMTYIFCLLCKKPRSSNAEAGCEKVAMADAAAAARVLRLVRSEGGAQQLMARDRILSCCLVHFAGCGSCAIQSRDPLLVRFVILPVIAIMPFSIECRNKI